MVGLFKTLLLQGIIFFGMILPPAYAESTTTVLLFGDSITAGYGLEEKDALHIRLKEALADEREIKTINAGVSGDTTSGGRSRLAWTLQKNNPDIVIIALGGNDALRGIPPTLTRENIEAMLSETTKYPDMTVILSAVMAPTNLGENYTKEFAAIYPELAEKYHAKLYPFYLEPIFGNDAFMQKDGIHPNAEGVKVIAEKLADYLSTVSGI